MGWSFRKGWKIGPIRIGLSKSGVSASTGVKGFRVRTGTAGTFVQAGKGPIQYRKKLRFRMGGGDHVDEGSPVEPRGGIGCLGWILILVVGGVVLAMIVAYAAS